jgi:hypothetical protein
MDNFDNLEQQGILSLKDWMSDVNKQDLQFLHQDMENFLKKHDTNHSLYDDIRDGIAYIESILKEDPSADLMKYEEEVRGLLRQAGITPSEI